MGKHSILRCHGLNKSYKDAGQSVDVLKDVELNVFKGDTLAIIGSSGSGKSTLLHILGTLDTADSGTLFFEDIDLFELDAKQQAKFRNQNLGFVYQFHHLLPEFTALENVAMPLLIGNLSREEAYERAQHGLSQVGLSHRIDHKPWQLSGGERQRIAIARAIINQPKVVMADEPTGNLDAKNSQRIIELIKEINQASNTTFIIVTHDSAMAEQMCHSLHLRDGKFTELGT